MGATIPSDHQDILLGTLCSYDIDSDPKYD